MGSRIHLARNRRSLSGPSKARIATDQVAFQERPLASSDALADRIHERPLADCARGSVRPSGFAGIAGGPLIGPAASP